MPVGADVVVGSAVGSIVPVGAVVAFGSAIGSIVSVGSDAVRVSVASAVGDADG